VQFSFNKWLMLQVLCKCGLVSTSDCKFFLSRVKTALDTIGNMLFPMLAAEWLHLVLYSTSLQNIITKNFIILFWKYLVDIRSEAWLNLCWEYIKLFAVCFT
jgi:hypothetical protein